MVLENLLLNHGHPESESAQYHVHYGPCCSSECIEYHDRQDEENVENNSNESLEEAARHPISDTASRKRKFSVHERNQYISAAPHSPQKPMGESLPSRVLDTVISVYFKTAHHWIPFLHESRFRARYQNTQERIKLEIVLHAMTYVAIRLVPPDIISKTDAHEIACTSQKMVLKSAFDDLSVENLQALAMIAFDHVQFQSSRTVLMLIVIARRGEVFKGMVHHWIFNTNCRISATYCRT